MRFQLSYAVRLLPHPAVTGAIVAAIMFGAARLVHAQWEHGASLSEFEIASQAGVALFCGALIYGLLSAILRSVRFYEILAKNSRDIILVIDDAGRLIEANQAALETYGLGRDEILGLDAKRLVKHGADCPIERVFESDQRFLAETVHVRKDGSEFPVEASLTPVSHYGGKVVLAVIRDISDRKRREIFETLVHQVDRRILAGDSLDLTLRFICEELSRVYRYPLVQVGLKGPGGIVEIREFAGEASNFLATVTVRWDDTPEGRGPTGTAIRTGEVQIRNLEEDENFFPWLAAARSYGFRSAIAVPLGSNGDLLGALTMFSRQDADVERTSFKEIESFAEQVALSIVAVRGQEQVRLQRTALEAAADGIMVTDPWGVIQWVNPAFEGLTGYRRNEVIGEMPKIFKSGLHEPAFYRSMWKTLANRETWRGEIYNKRRDGSIYLEEQTITPVLRDDGEIAHFVAIKEDISHRREQEDRINFLATNDPMTELPNRKSFVTYLDRAVEQAVRGRNGAVLVADIHNFRLVNDTLGHLAGDQLLRQFAGLLKQTFRPSDPIARLGGDQFAVLMEGATVEVAQVAAERLRRTVEGAGAHDGWEIPSVALSVGIAEVDASIDPEGVIRRATVAMIAARSTNHGRPIAYSPKLEDANGVAEGGRMALRIRNAIREGRFVLNFQKVVCLTCEMPEHYEALVRMIDERGAIVPPSDFIPTAERFGLMHEIDGWVVSHVIERLAKDRELKIFVNLSGRSLTDDVLLRKIERQCVDSGLAPGQLTIEITEATAVTDFVAAQGWIHRLKKVGCLFALDDFGIGFSSLSYLQSLSVDFVKIDRSFVTDIHRSATNRAIVQAVQAVAASLGKEVIAEGVESEAHLVALRAIGITHGQGFHWGRPGASLGGEPSMVAVASGVGGGVASGLMLAGLTRCRC